ncbi:MAG: hypothetical protein QG635_1371, partial [Bacteroidota bacterium]|nr:hypothetical protein [Bacteroidota bacterium]
MLIIKLNDKETLMFGKNKKNEYRHDDESNKNNELDLLTQVSIELSSIPSTDDIYIYLGKKLKEISGAIAVAVSEYSNSKKVIITRYVETESEKLNKFINISGVKIIGLESPVSELDYSLITESVIGYKDSLSDVTFGTINPIISKIVNKTFRIGKFIGIAYIFDNQLYGTSVLVMKKGDPLPSEQLLRLFAGLAWVSLRRISAERELRESENKYRTLFSHSALAVALRNPDWEFVECNDAYLTMLGYRRDEIQNLTLENISHPDDIQFTKDAINRVRSGVSEIEKYEKRYVHKSGEIVWGEVCLQSLKNPKGRIVAFIGTVIIITERKIAEEKLRKSEANYRLIADNAADVIWRM